MTKCWISTTKIISQVLKGIGDRLEISLRSEARYFQNRRAGRENAVSNITNLPYAVKDPRFASAFVKSRREVVDQTKSLNSRLSGGHLESIASQLLAEVELLLQ